MGSCVSIVPFACPVHSLPAFPPCPCSAPHVASCTTPVQLPTGPTYFVRVRAQRHVGAIALADFATNRALVEAHKAQLPRCWDESKGMAKFYMQDLVDAGIMHERERSGGHFARAVDAGGVPRTIYRRTKAAIQRFIDAVHADHALAAALGSSSSSSSPPGSGYCKLTRRCTGVGRRGSRVNKATHGQAVTYTA